jgi:hypothetical protein
VDVIMRREEGRMEELAKGLEGLELGGAAPAPVKEAEA